MLVKSTHLTGRARLSAKKSDRKGGMLLLVVIIMAVALILITSALTITTAARNRYYNSALTDQATITATSVAKTIGAAVEKGDITLTEIEALAAANGGAGTLIPVTSAASATKTAGSAGTDKTKAAAPGLYNDTSRSYTNVLVKYFTNSAGKKLIQIQATTGLDVNGAASTKTQTESVYLEKITLGPPGGAFSSLLFCGRDGSVNKMNNITVGDTPPGMTAPESNYVIMKGDVGIGYGSQVFISDVVFTGQLRTGAGNKYSGNVVFYGNDASIDAESSGGDSVDTDGMIFFLGDDISKGTGQQNVFTNTAGNPIVLSRTWAAIKADLGIYFYNTNMQVGINSNQITSPIGFYMDSKTTFKYTGPNLDPVDGKVYLSSSADLTSFYTLNSVQKLFASRSGIQAPDGNNGAAFIVALKAEAASICSSAMIATAERELPYPLLNNPSGNQSDADKNFYTDYGIAYKTVDEVKAHATLLTTANLTTESATPTTYTNSAYYIDVAATPNVGNNCAGEGCYYATPTELRFDLTSNDITIYIFGNGNELRFGSGLFRFVNGGVHVGRIVLMDGVKIYICSNWSPFDNGIIGATHVPDSGLKTKISYVMPLPKPFLYIYGINNNRIEAGMNSFIEGFIGLYGNDGTLYFKNCPNFYGRPEASNIAGEQQIMMVDYCPSPTEGGTGGSTTSSFYQVSGYQAA